MGGQTECTVCPAGFYCPITTQAVQIPCDTGTFSLGGATECTLCPAGKACSSTGTIEDCSPGQYSLEGESVCNNCDAGFYCPFTTLAVQIACLQGTYSIAGQSSCTICPPGFACPSTASSVMITCPAGTFSTGQQSACTSCVAGYSCSSTTSSDMTPCAAGFYSLSGAASCSVCPAGSFCASRSSSPVDCPEGTYSSAGQTSCTLSTPGFFAAGAGNTGEIMCGVGYYSSGGASSCTLCNPGYRCPSGSSDPSPSSAACQIGGFCNPANVYTPCPSGTYGIVSAGISLEHACAPCEPGYICPTEGTVASTREICPAGGYCPEGSDTITLCSPGYRGFRTGQSSIVACETCDRGTYCSNAGTVDGRLCPAGYFCPEGTATFAAYPCPAGTFSESQGLFSAGQCRNCTAGNYCLGPSSPLSCPGGTYNPFPGGSSMSSCLPCEAGFACPASGMSSLVVPCSRGYFCPPGTVNPSQYSCPAGTFSDSVNLVSHSGCTQCPAGYTCGVSTTTAQLQECRLGYYCPNGTASGFDIPCPPGTFSANSLLGRAAECSICPPGSFCSGGEITVSGPCSAGYVCPAGSMTPTQLPCPAGTFSSETDLFNIAQCLECGAGFYCEEAATQMTPCPAGTYSSQNGTESAGPGVYPACQTCSAGYKCIEGSTMQVECGVGFYSDFGEASCHICPLGRYCGSNTTTNSSLFTGGGSWAKSGDPAGLCFNGTYCPLGMQRAPDLLRDACPAGFYCPAGTRYPVACPPGTFNGVTGQDALSDCQFTPAGFYSIQNATKPTGLCSPGFYCPVGSSGPQQVPCPVRTYLPDFGGQSQRDCSLCTAGGYCPQNSALPVVCPRGYYCVAGISDPLPCPVGTYGNSTGLLRSDQCTPCDGGFFCDGLALTAPRGLCASGLLFASYFICNHNSKFISRFLLYQRQQHFSTICSVITNLLQPFFYWRFVSDRALLRSWFNSSCTMSCRNFQPSTWC